jgi:anthranilate phosphoribosyltransferase
VLTALGIRIEDDPTAVGPAVERDGIGFVSYAAFCPAYAARYDGVFRVLSPLSFFMPVAVLAVTASRFLYGIAHRDVPLAAATLRAVRPALATGFAVMTEIGPDEIMDESATAGTTHTATLHGSRVEVSRRVQPPPTEAWRRAVAHRTHHAANAHAVVDSLSSNGHPVRAELVEQNAALVLIAAHDGQLSVTDALAQVQEARRSARAQRLLARLQTRKDTASSCTAN